MKKTIIFLTILLLLIIVPLSSLTFKYAFLYIQADQEIKTIDYQAISTPLVAGDQLKIYLKPMQNAYIYIFFQDTQDNLYLLFPEVISDFDQYYQFNKNYYIPKGDDWFYLDDNKGTEYFYLLVTDKRFTWLEELTKKYLASFYSSTGTDAALKEQRQQVIEEIKRLRLEQTQDALKEDISLVACDFRGIGDQYEFNAVEVEAEGFYARTIRIEH